MSKKMSYRTFKIYATEEIKNHLPREYDDWRVEWRTVYKVNEKLDCLHLSPPPGEICVAVPNLYFEDFYEFVKSGYSAEKAVGLMADVVTSCPSQETLRKADFHMDKFRENIVWMVINREKNQELLQTVPHRPVPGLDLEIIYRLLVFSPYGNMVGGMVNNDMMRSFRETEESLYERAKNHTRSALPVKIDNLSDVIVETSEDPDEDLSGIDPSPFYMLSNEMRTFGAAAMLYPDVLEEVALIMGGDYYILPSSIHELMMIPVSYGSAKMFQKMVRGANSSVVSKGDWLSDQVYLYQCEKKSLTLT